MLDDNLSRGVFHAILENYSQTAFLETKTTDFLFEVAIYQEQSTDVMSFHDTNHNSMPWLMRF